MNCAPGYRDERAVRDGGVRAPYAGHAAGRPAFCAPANAYAANPYGRDTWSRPRPAEPSRGTSGPRRGEIPPRGSAAPAGCASAPGRRVTAEASHATREGLRLVPMVGMLALAVFLIIAVFQLVGIYQGAGGGAVVAVTGARPAAGAAAAADAVSTPRDEWRVGEVPFLYQIDEAWADAPYAGSDVAESGCGPTSLAMVYVALTGNIDYDPAAMAAFSEQAGFVEDGMTAWRLMTEGAAARGLASREVPADKSRLLAELSEGHPVICSVGPGDFTSKGHFIVLAGATDDGQLVVHDPNSPENSARTWDADRVLAQCRNLWAFERA